MRHIKLILAGVSTLALTSVASAQVDVDFAAPSDHNSGNSHVFISFSGAQKAGTPNPSSTEVNLIVNNGQTGYQNMSSINGGLCSTNPTPTPGEYYELCGCYFDLTQVDTSGPDINITAMYRSTIGGNVETGLDTMTIPKNGGPLRPPATAPMCAPISGSPLNFAPTANAGPDSNIIGNQRVVMNGNGSSDPENDPLTYSWFQTSGPTVELHNPTSAAPSFYAPDVTSQSVIEFKLNVQDNQGNASAGADQVTFTITPDPQTRNCQAWTRDSVRDSLAFWQTKQNGKYTIKYRQTGAQVQPLIAEATRIKRAVPAMEKFQIRSYLYSAGTGTSPSGSVAVPGALTLDYDITSTLGGPAPSAQWSTLELDPSTWYRIDTKLNLYDINNNFTGSGGVYTDNCKYSTLYFQGGSHGLSPLALTQSSSRGGLNTTSAATGISSITRSRNAIGALGNETVKSVPKATPLTEREMGKKLREEERKVKQEQRWKDKFKR